MRHFHMHNVSALARHPENLNGHKAIEAVGQ
jgi:hypothetical protein